MHPAIRTMTALFAVLGAIGLARADGEGGPGDSGVGGAGASASAVTVHASRDAHKGMPSRKASTTAKRANGSPEAASGTKATDR